MAEEREKTTILIAEDEEINRTILREILKSKYRVLEAENGHQAVFCIKAEETNISLIILDIHMPKLDGFGVMDYLNETGLNEKIPVIITTSDESPEVLIQGKKNKVVDIVYKPFRAADIIKTVDNLVEIGNLEQNLEEIINEKSLYLTNQYEAAKRIKTFHHLRWDENIKIMMDNLLPDNVAHNERIARYTQAMCDGMMLKYPKYGLSKSVTKAITDSSRMHDIGKVIIPDHLFDKKDPSAARAILQMKKRPAAGAELINIVFANAGHQVERKYSFEICKCMYETFDGKGYPVGLSGNEIPLCAQLVGIVHRYDELRFLADGSVKPHRSVMRKILEAEYKSFNPDILEVFEEISDTIEEIADGNNKGE